MQEVFEKIKERLEEEVKYQNEQAEEAPPFCELTFEEARRKMAECYEHAIEIVNQVAEEYNQSLDNNNQSLTNADKIRNMTDEKLAEFLFEQTHCDYCNIRTKCRQIDADNCHDVFLVWLQSEVEE